MHHGSVIERNSELKIIPFFFDQYVLGLSELQTMHGRQNIAKSYIPQRLSESHWHLQLGARRARLQLLYLSNIPCFSATAVAMARRPAPYSPNLHRISDT